MQIVLPCCYPTVATVAVLPACSCGFWFIDLAHADGVLAAAVAAAAAVDHVIDFIMLYTFCSYHLNTCKWVCVCEWVVSQRQLLPVSFSLSLFSTFCLPDLRPHRTGSPAGRRAECQHQEQQQEEEKEQGMGAALWATSTLLLLSHKNVYVFNLEFCYCFYQSLSRV